MPRLSVIIPALNEQPTIAQVVAAVARTGCAHEIVVTDDGSTDGTADALHEFARAHAGLLRVVRHPRPRGKGAAIRSALPLVSGDVVLIQDADLEYDPADYPALLAPFADPAVQAVYGSRNLNPSNPRFSFSYYWGGRLLSWTTNVLFHARLTDESTGYKLVRTPLLRELNLQRDGFDFCAELTGKLLRRGIAIHEVPIAYRPRSFAEGKKVRWRDGLAAIRVLIRERLRARVLPIDASPLRPQMELPGSRADFDTPRLRSCP